MPVEFEYEGYKVYFWSRENNEPIHVHISKKPSSNATKVWLTSNGGCFVAHNKSRVPPHILKSILDAIVRLHSRICKDWKRYYNYLTFRV